ncbi:MAG TPA: 4Fe-4S binding protein [Caldilineae bacterium]|nr:4Fe-4S binding protein [Caldilineae bacterium]
MEAKQGLWTALREHVRLARELRRLRIHFHSERCRGCWQCYEVCPIGCWMPDRERRAVMFQHAQRCIACGACVLQCPTDAIELKR